MKKDTTKIKKEVKNKGEDAVEEIKKATDELSKMTKKMKSKYHDMDESTKKKALAGIAGVTAVIAGIVGGKKIKDKIKKDK